MKATGEFLRNMGLPPFDIPDASDSKHRFPDGAQYRVEVPSVEGPACLEAVLEEASRLGVVVHRVSQGSGVFMQTDAELRRLARIAAEARVEVSLFARPGAGWGLSAGSVMSAGAVMSATARGQEQVLYQLEDIKRAADHGFRSVLITDLGVLAVFREMRAGGELPADMQAKVSVMLPVSNASAARVVASLGADTLNVSTDLTLAQLAAIRAAIEIPLDIYIESPDSLGGFTRQYEIPEIVRIAAPVYLKFGLRNAPDIYPSGTHLEDLALRLSRERVRRARLGIELLQRYFPDAVSSQPGAQGLAVPVSAADVAVKVH